MSGKIEDKLEAFLNKWTAKISFLPELKDLSERKLAGKHITYMGLISILPLTIGLMADLPRIGAIVSLGTFALVVEAERPPIGRKIDWVTRGAGWLIGAILSLIVLAL